MHTQCSCSNVRLLFAALFSNNGCISFSSLSFFIPGFEVNSSEQQGNEVLAVGSDTVRVQDTTIVDHEAGNGTDVDMSTCQSAEVVGDKDHATETVLECIQARCDGSDKDHSADLPATTLVTPEFNKITTCDMDVVCAGNSESSGNGESGTIGVQEAAAVAEPGSMNDQALACSGGGESVKSVQEAAAVADPGSMDGQALASSGGENVTGVQEAAAVVDAGSTHGHLGDRAPGNVSQGNASHHQHPSSFSPFILVHMHQVGEKALKMFCHCLMVYCTSGRHYLFACGLFRY
jgi:hypothetical protein